MTDSQKENPYDQTSVSIPQLRAVLNGQVIAPGDAEYDAARTVFLGSIDRRPAVIVRVENAADVSHVVSLARETGLELAVRSGGHSDAGHSVSDGGIVLDLSKMLALQIDVEQRTAWVETGLTAAAVTMAAGRHGLAIGFGDTGSVGVGGITLGGGVGYLVRKYGLTIDSLLAAEIVTADGQLLRVDAENHPDLFWAIRGGGGNFGVVTRFNSGCTRSTRSWAACCSYRQHPTASPGSSPQPRPRRMSLSTIANVMAAPPMPFVPTEYHGQLIIMAILAYAGEVEAGQRAIAPFRALATPIADMVRPMRYPEIYPPDDENYHPIAASRTMFIDHIDRPVAETILDHLRASTASMAVAQLRVLGGAMARVPVEATAFAHRQRRIMVNVAALYQHPDEKATHETWVKRFHGGAAPG